MGGGTTQGVHTLVHRDQVLNIPLMVQKSGEKTTRDGAKTLFLNNGIIYLSTGAGFLNHQQ